MANEVEKIDFGNGDVFEIPKPNNAEIVIKQGGVEKGRFTVNASEPVEIDLDSGYKKPSGGITKNDLDRYVQESLEKADTALQNHQDISGKVDRTSNSTQFIKSESADTVVCFQSGATDYSWIGLKNNEGSNIGWFGASKDKKPFFYGNSAKQLALKDDIPTSLPANGGNAATVNGLTVQTAVPANAKFTDTNTWRPLGTGANDACAGNDSRLSNSRPANGGTSAACSGNSATATTSTYVKDSTDNKNINITYAKAGQNSTSWLASWNGYEIGAISPSKLSVNYANSAGSIPKRFSASTNASSVSFTYNLGTPSGRTYFFVTIIGQSGQHISCVVAVSQQYALYSWAPATLTGNVSATGCTVSKSGTNVTITITTNSSSLWGAALIEVL